MGKIFNVYGELIGLIQFLIHLLVYCAQLTVNYAQKYSLMLNLSLL